MRLIDADKVDFNEVFAGASDFARDTRAAAQSLIDSQPTAYDIDEGIQQISGIMDKDSIRYCNQAVNAAIRAVRDGIKN